MPSQILLSDAQRLEFTSVPETITDDELEYFYSLRDEDIQIVKPTGVMRTGWDSP